jgi:hypothetical protein
MFLHPLFLLPSFLILNFNNIVHNEKLHAKKLQDSNNVIILKANLSNGCAKDEFKRKNAPMTMI